MGTTTLRRGKPASFDCSRRVTHSTDRLTMLSVIPCFLSFLASDTSHRASLQGCPFILCRVWAPMRALNKRVKPWTLAEKEVVARNSCSNSVCYGYTLRGARYGCPSFCTVTGRLFGRLISKYTSDSYGRIGDGKKQR
jgi:hypothetical protein